MQLKVFEGRFSGSLPYGERSWFRIVELGRRYFEDDQGRLIPDEDNCLLQIFNEALLETLEGYTGLSAADRDDDSEPIAFGAMPEVEFVLPLTDGLGDYTEAGQVKVRFSAPNSESEGVSYLASLDGLAEDAVAALDDPADPENIKTDLAALSLELRRAAEKIDSALGNYGEGAA